MLGRDFFLEIRNFIFIKNVLFLINVGNCIVILLINVVRYINM